LTAALAPLLAGFRWNPFSDFLAFFGLIFNFIFPLIKFIINLRILAVGWLEKNAFRYLQHVYAAAGGAYLPAE